MVAISLSLALSFVKPNLAGSWAGYFEEIHPGVVKTNAMKGKVPTMLLNKDNTWQQKIGTVGRFKVTKGKWKLEGSKLTLWTTTIDSKPFKDPNPRVLTLSADGRSMSMIISAPISKAQPKPMKFRVAYQKVN
ncbi:MAG: hypothetical protein ABL949_03145 [Fimbriimonadaceae bacterium]